MTVAARVAQELGCEVGQKVGYSIRFEDVSTPVRPEIHSHQLSGLPILLHAQSNSSESLYDLSSKQVHLPMDYMLFITDLLLAQSKH